MTNQPEVIRLTWNEDNVTARGNLRVTSDSGLELETRIRALLYTEGGFQVQPDVHDDQMVIRRISTSAMKCHELARRIVRELEGLFNVTFSLDIERAE